MKGQPLRGGDVTAFSQGGGSGSEFVLRLPILIEAAPQPPVPGSGRLASTPPRARRILVADDNEDAATTLAQLLDMLGHQTRIAFDGEAAVEAALAFRPDLVLLDIGMPRLSGYAVARKLRQQPWGASLYSQSTHTGMAALLIGSALETASTNWLQSTARRKPPGL